jgi:hypothetical protein
MSTQPPIACTLTEAERFARMELRDDPDALTLTVEGPEGSQPVVRELLAAFTGEEAA